MLEFSEYTKILIGLLAIINPIGAVPIVISLTTNLSLKKRQRLPYTITFAVMCILFVAFLIGEPILNFFGISINSFRVAGGILILLMAISMLHAHASPVQQTDAEREENVDKDAVAIVPLAMPLLAGPGAISTIILYTHKGSGLTHYLAIAAIILIIAAIPWGVLKLLPWISSHMSQTGLNIVTRIMGLILATIAIEFIANGLKGLFPVLMS